MKQLRFTTALLVVLLGGQLGGCALSGRAGPVADVVDDAAITAGVRAAIDSDQSLKLTELGVDTMPVVVQQIGVVGSADSVADEA